VIVAVMVLRRADAADAAAAVVEVTNARTRSLSRVYFAVRSSALVKAIYDQSQMAEDFLVSDCGYQRISESV
jgi:hypothetical protein